MLYECVEPGQRIILCRFPNCLLCPSNQGSAKLQVLQDAWAECQGQWTRSGLYKRISERRSVTSKGARVWMTRAQIARKYESWDVANEICNSKLADEELKATHTKPHPDAPNNEVGTDACSTHDILCYCGFVAQ